MIFSVVRLQHGFSLPELLILVAVLAILAFIVVPQFSSPTDATKIAALDSSLSNMRSAIGLYYRQHGKYPSATAASGATCPSGGTAGIGAADSSDAFISQLTKYTNAAGQACSTTDGTFKYGPYMKQEALPNNPITDKNTLVVVTAGNLALTAGGTTGGWRFDNRIGKFITDHTDYDDR